MYGLWGKVDELTGAAIDTQDLGAPEAPQQEFIEVVGDVDDKAVESYRAAEKQSDRTLGLQQETV